MAEPATTAPSVSSAAGRSLGAKLFLRTFPVVALIVLVTQAAVAVLMWTDQRRDLERHATMVAELTAEAIARPLWYFDRTVFEPQIRAIARDSDFRFARVFDDQGVVLFETGDPSALAADDVIVVARDVVEPSERRTVGRLEVVIGTEALTHTFWLLAGAGTAAFAVLLIGFSAAAQAAVRRLVLRPLGSLLAAMGRVERKDWTTVDWRSDDELGHAAAAFNRMVEGLRSGDEAKRLLAELRATEALLLERNAAVEHASSLILASIRYARRIQESVLSDPRALDGMMAEVALWWEPLHVVGGDFYRIERKGPVAVLIVADCTGHGVPGAFMTLVVAAALEDILQGATPDCLDPSAILLELDRMVRDRLRQGAGAEDPEGAASDDGLEAAACLYDERTGELSYAGAGIALVAQHQGRVERVRADRAALGYRSLPAPQRLRVHRRVVRPGECFFLYSDGVSDQVGGAPKRMYGRRRLAEIIAAGADLPLADQIDAIRRRHDSYRGDEPRRDDLTLLAFRPLAGSAHREDTTHAGA